MNWNTQKLRKHIGLLALAAWWGSLEGAAAAQVEAPVTWHAQNLGQALAYMLLFAFIGIAVAIVGYKLFDLCTPGDLHKEILENRNMAAAIVAAAVILGVCIIIAAAMLG